jgi:chemotaxis protein MotB
VARAKRRHEEPEEHGNHERWLVSYADMMTLLMVLFIVMFAISQVDQRRFEMLKDGMAAGFGQSASPFQGSEGTMSSDGIKPLEPVQPDPPVGGPDKVVVNAGDRTAKAGKADKADEASESSEASKAYARDYASAQKEVDRLDALRRRIERTLRSKGYLDDVRLNIDERGLSISLVSRHIVFRANEADLTPRGRQVLDVLAPVLTSLQNRIEVDGHTNQVKVKPKYYPTDWELSAARAVGVLRYLDERRGVPARRMSAVAFGHEKPLRDPSLPGAAALNKRVDLIVVSDAPESTRKLFRTVVRDHRAAATSGGTT